MKSIDKPSVYIRDSVGVRDKLRKLYESGPEKLQVFNEHVADCNCPCMDSPNQLFAAIHELEFFILEFDCNHIFNEIN